MTKLPIGIQTFRKLREGGYCYADKTPLIERLAREGQMYFLARPRRFGKSLLVTTLADAFAGHRELLGSFDVDRIEPEALLFQTGYLTIRERYQRSGLYRYRLRYPNFEVRASLPAAILNTYVPNVQDRLRTEDRIYAALEADEPDGLYRAFHAFFASIPHDSKGCDQPWPHRPVDPLRRARVSVGIQGSGIQ